MTPKEQYEAKKAARDKARQDKVDRIADQEAKDEMLLLLVERFVGAFERIADSVSAIEMNTRPGGM